MITLDTRLDALLQHLGIICCEKIGLALVRGSTHLGSWRGLPPTGRKVDFPLIIVFVFDGEEMVCERTYFNLGTPLTQLGVARDPNSRAGKLTTMLNHPIVVGRALIRSMIHR